jgi:hypothetical protein
MQKWQSNLALLLSTIVSIVSSHFNFGKKLCKKISKYTLKKFFSIKNNLIQNILSRGLYGLFG